MSAIDTITIRLAHRRRRWPQPIALAAVLCGLPFVGACRQPAGDAPPPCCRLTVEWRTHPAVFAGHAGSEERLLGRLQWVAQRFREHHVCLEWQRGPDLTTPRLYVGGEQVPQLDDWTERAAVDRPTLLLVRRLQAAVDGQYVARKGATPGAGAAVAAVRIGDRHGDGIAIRNELLHVFGLTDRDVGATAADNRHRVSAAQWRFVRDVCLASVDKVEKRARVVAKEKCLAAAGHQDPAACFDRPH